MQPISQAQVKKWLPVRASTAHKGHFGRVLVVAGSRSMCGAGWLCAKSALTAGAGLVYWALPESMQPAFAAVLPEAITLPLPENADGYIDKTAWELFPDICEKYKPSLVVAGPGMGASPLLPELLFNISLPLIVDADALNALAQIPAWHSRWPQERPAVFTPHMAEISRLLNKMLVETETSRQEYVQELGCLCGGVCLLKGHPTLLWQQSQFFYNTTGGPALAKAGSGDVLAGVIAGLWAQLGSSAGFSVDTALKAAVCAVYIHGLAGDLASQTKSDFSVLASDTVTYLARAFQRVQEFS